MDNKLLLKLKNKSTTFTLFILSLGLYTFLIMKKYKGETCEIPLLLVIFGEKQETKSILFW